MAPKKQINAFYFYMKDLQLELREGGKTIPMKDMAEIANPKYKALPHEEKLRYERMVKEDKAKRKKTQCGRLTSDGVPITQLLAEEQERKEMQMEIVTSVHSMIFQNLDSITDMKIYIISFNVMVVTRENEHYPNEIGLVEFSLRDGIRKIYHAFIDPGQIPIGYFSAAKHHSADSHQLPIPMSDAENFNLTLESDYGKILNHILDFTDAHKGPKILFSHESQVEQTEGSLEFLRSQSPRIKNNKNVTIANLVVLLNKLFSIAGYPLPTRVEADDLLVQNMFDFALQSRCEFHEERDSCYCALGYARKMCFIISDSLVKHFGLELTPAHLPQRVEMNFEVVNLKDHDNTPDSEFLQMSLGDKSRYESRASNSRRTRAAENRENDDTELMMPKEVLIPSSTSRFGVALGLGAGIGRGRGVFGRPLNDK